MYFRQKLVKNIIKPFQNPEVDVVAGIYKPYYTNDFEYFQGLVVVPEPEKINSPSRMSSRSIAFKKNCRKKVKGYPDLNTGEDTAFNLKLQAAGFNFAFAKNAVVYWRMRKSWKEFAKQFYKYGVGDRKAGNIWKMRKNLIFAFGFWFYVILVILSIFISLPLLLILLAFLLLYFLYYGVKVFLKSKKLNGITDFLLVLIKRTAYVIGVCFGK